MLSRLINLTFIVTIVGRTGISRIALESVIGAQHIRPISCHSFSQRHV